MYDPVVGDPFKHPTIHEARATLNHTQILGLWANGAAVPYVVVPPADLTVYLLQMCAIRVQQTSGHYTYGIAQFDCCATSNSGAFTALHTDFGIGIGTEDDAFAFAAYGEQVGSSNIGFPQYYQKGMGIRVKGVVGGGHASNIMTIILRYHVFQFDS
jgi:hypothetical protein